MHKSLEPDLGRMIAYCGHLGRQSTDQMLRRAGYDVTPVQTQALMYLACRQRNRETSQRDLERELHLKASTVNGIVGRLEETERRFTAGLTDQELKQLQTLLERIAANLENEVSNP